MKKGFTLIELMAVIVILGIIAVISVPILKNTIDDSRKEAFKSSVKGLMKAADTAFNDSLYSGNYSEITFTFTSEGYTSSVPGIELDYKGDLPTEGYLTLNEEGFIELRVHSGKYCITKAYFQDVIEEQGIKDYADCLISVVPDVGPDPVVTYYNATKGVNAPVIKAGMTPVKWDGSSWVDTTEDDTGWYDYTSKEWANARTNDGSMWVWIPRYAYKITSGHHSSTSGTIDIKFLIDKTNTSSDATPIENSGYEFGIKDASVHYFLHPAFTFGIDEKPGMWVSKFEPSNDGANNPEFKPNAVSWRSIAVGNIFDIAMEMKNNNSKYGWNSVDIDTHMMKNSEWGAIAYLAKNNVYGKGTEIWINNDSTYHTGCSGNTVSAASNAGCQNTYNTTNGLEASTTGNIYGIYDMAGGAWEYMSAMTDNNTNTNVASNGNFNDISETRTNYGDKYFDIYIGTTTSDAATNYEDNKNFYGGASYETSSASESTNSWNSGYTYFPISSFPWMMRGGYFGTANSAGTFNLSRYFGDANSTHSFRVVVFAD